MTRIIMNQFYLHENNLVRVIGAHGMLDAATMTFAIEWFVWTDGKDERHTAEVTRRELSEAPTMPRLYADYRQALDVICQMANKIEGLEESRDLWQAEALRLRTKTDEIPF